MIKINRFMKNEKGFTLVELLVVIVIIGILATIAIPRLIGVRERANRTKSIGNLRTIQTALEMYYVDEGEYPGKDDWKTALTTGKSLVNENVLEIPASEKDYEYKLEGDGYIITDAEYKITLTPEGIVEGIVEGSTGDDSE